MKVINIFFVVFSISQVGFSQAPTFSNPGPITICELGSYYLAPSTTTGTWASTDPTKATVNSNGYVTALDAGTTIVSLTTSGGTVTATINVVSSTLYSGAALAISQSRVAYKFNGAPQGPVASIYMGYDGFNYSSTSRPSNVGFYRANNQLGNEAGCPSSFYIFNCTNCDVAVINNNDGSSPSRAALSGVQLKEDYPSKPSGWYWIKSPSMPNPLEMYVDMTEEGGGYDFYFITAGPSVSHVTDVNGGTPLGLDLIYPRSQSHWKAMYNAVNAAIAAGKAGGASFNDFFLTTYGVYRNTTDPVYGGDYTPYIMRNPTHYGSGAPDWRVKDGGRWWLMDAPFSEPNGDYPYNGLLGFSGSHLQSNGILTWFNDGWHGYSTGNFYMVSTNSKQ
jgi:hypothetical protein